MRFFFAVVLVATTSFWTAFSAPAPLQYDTAHIDPAHPIHDQMTHNTALQQANVQITQMITCVSQAGADASKKGWVAKAFGPDVVLNDLLAKMFTLQTYVMRIRADNVATGGVFASTTHPADGSQATVTFGQLFHATTTTANQRIRTVIHEASHAAFKTYDNFVISGQGLVAKFGSDVTAADQDNLISGYYHDDFDVMHSTYPQFLYMNADSFALLGYICAHNGAVPGNKAMW
jgi:hypothetical protein